jgi:hypothetical protein
MWFSGVGGPPRNVRVAGTVREAQRLASADEPWLHIGGVEPSRPLLTLLADSEGNDRP